MNWCLMMTVLAIWPWTLSAEQQQQQQQQEPNRVTNNRGPNRGQRPFWGVRVGNRRKMQHRNDPSPVTPKPNPVNFVPQQSPSRDHRFLSLFTLVRFDNITVTCGQNVIFNNTYFINPSPSTYDGTDCQVNVVKIHPDVCQFRLDFLEFDIRGPEITNNLCTYDMFTVLGAAGNYPIICGKNSGNHMYVDVGSGPTVTLSLVTSGNGFERFWRILITQIPCASVRAEGCLQYYTGVSGMIKSFNWDPNVGLQLSNQDYSICIRTERNFCGIQYMTCDDGGLKQQPREVWQSCGSSRGTAHWNFLLCAFKRITNPNVLNQQQGRSSSFGLSGNTLAGNFQAMTDRNCQTDYLMIPCGFNSGRSPNNQICSDRFCGGAFNTEPSVNSTSVISTVKPFRLVFHTDGTEAPSDYGNRGFCLNYVQQPCTMKLR